MRATSLESMLGFGGGIFGRGAHFQVLRTTHHGKPTSTSQSPILQNYTIMEVPREIFNTKMVACHTMPLPLWGLLLSSPSYSISKVFKVSLEGEDGDKVEAIAVDMPYGYICMVHVSFLVLKIEPGSDPVCHFFPEGLGTIPCLSVAT